MQLARIISKTQAVIRKGPATARNILFSQFDYWPVRRLNNEALLAVPVYCVNLASDLRRRRIIEQQMANMGFDNLHFVDAIPGYALDYAALIANGEYDDTAAQQLHGQSLTLNCIGGSLSHGHCYDLIVERGHDIALIIEDDALFLPSRLDRVELSDLPESWDIAFLNSFLKAGPPRRRIAGSLFQGDAYWGSAAAYLVSRKGAQALADHYRPVTTAADGYTGNARFERYMYYPDCALNGSVCYYYNTTLPSLLGGDVNTPGRSL